MKIKEFGGSLGLALVFIGCVAFLVSVFSEIVGVLTVDNLKQVVIEAKEIIRAESPTTASGGESDE